MSPDTLSGQLVGAHTETFAGIDARALAWQEQAACLPDRLGMTEAEIDAVFFPERGGSASARGRGVRRLPRQREVPRIRARG